MLIIINQNNYNISMTLTKDIIMYKCTYVCGKVILKIYRFNFTEK